MTWLIVASGLLAVAALTLHGVLVAPTDTPAPGRGRPLLSRLGSELLVAIPLALLMMLFLSLVVAGLNATADAHLPHGMLR